jgi:hypothetical protein
MWYYINTSHDSITNTLFIGNTQEMMRLVFAICGCFFFKEWHHPVYQLLPLLLAIAQGSSSLRRNIHQMVAQSGTPHFCARLPVNSSMAC